VGAGGSTRGDAEERECDRRLVSGRTAAASLSTWGCADSCHCRNSSATHLDRSDRCARARRPRTCEEAAARQLRRYRRARGTTELSVGDALSGTVIGVTSYGLFVDVSATDGLVRRSEITMGQEGRADLASSARERAEGRCHRRGPRAPWISLSIKRTGADPWERCVNELETGQTVDATVTRVMPCGTFARFAGGVEGLIHVTELGGEWVADLTGSVHVGDVVRVRIVAIDGSGGGCRCLFPRQAHMNRSPEGGRVGFRTYNRNQMMPTPIYGLEEF
jgi:predicted RNA-binding protein with RPS1 domain